MGKYNYFTLEKRKEIQRLYESGLCVKAIASEIDSTASSVYRELEKGRTGRMIQITQQVPEYSAELANDITKSRMRMRGQQFRRRGATP